mmetsp:Transcript_5450/g.4623  ORF Transcript_5450/g.4623 Transcript_5450/m.4623 type:complete len:266 (-) Transcript_5450:18-815(-)
MNQEMINHKVSMYQPASPKKPNLNSSKFSVSKKLSLNSRDISFEYGLKPVEKSKRLRDSQKSKLDKSIIDSFTTDLSKKNTKSKSPALRSHAKSVMHQDSYIKNFKNFNNKNSIRNSIRKIINTKETNHTSSLSPKKNQRMNRSGDNSLFVTTSDSNTFDIKKSGFVNTPKYLKHVLQRQFQDSMAEKVRIHGEMLKKLEKQKRMFYWLPDLSLAGFATENQIKKNHQVWNSSGRKMKKERVIDWKNPQGLNKQHREDQDYQIWK